jgi:hypothetical protein
MADRKVAGAPKAEAGKGEAKKEEKKVPKVLQPFIIPITNTTTAYNSSSSSQLILDIHTHVLVLHAYALLR